MEKNFESIRSPKFSHLEIEKMKRIKGGGTAHTATVYQNNTVKDDGTPSQDHIYND